MRNLSLLIVMAVALFMQGCGSEEDTQSSNDNVNSANPVFITLESADLGLYDWKKPRIYPKGVVLPECNSEKIFSLRPIKNSIDVKFVDYTQQNIYPANYTLRAVHTRDPNVVVGLSYNSQTESWQSDCIDVYYAGKLDIYPTYWVEVLDESGKVVTKDRISLYDVATDNCSACHASNSGYERALPVSGPSNLADIEADYKTNILKLHDQKHTLDLDLISELQAKGKNYSQAGLYETSMSSLVSCTDCHGINGVQGSGIKSIPALTNAIHDVHTGISDPNLIGSNNCLTCHPGESIVKTFNGKIIHTMESWWRSEDGHGEWAESRGATSCTLCHGPDLRGTKISNNQSCYECHGREWGPLYFTSSSTVTDTFTSSQSSDDWSSEEDEDEDD